MKLYGHDSENPLGSDTLLQRIVRFRRVSNFFYCLMFVFVFWYAESYAAMYLFLALSFISPAFHLYAFITKKSRDYINKTSALNSYAFVVFSVPLIYLTRDIDFICLIICPITIGLYSSINHRYNWLVLITLLLTHIGLLWPVTNLITLSTLLASYALVLSFTHLFSVRVQVDNATLAQLALQDALTGLKNRRALELDMSNSEIRKKVRSVTFLDVDHFKRINDQHGHIFGDKVLKSVADAIKRSISNSDEAYRYGGEEFVIVSQNKQAHQQMCLKLKEEIQHVGLAAKSTKHQQEVHFTASLGVCLDDDKKNLHQLVKDADSAMYHAKKTGRNRIVLFGDPMLPINENEE